VISTAKHKKQVDALGKEKQAPHHRDNSGSKVQTFKVQSFNRRVTPVPIVPAVQPLRSVQNVQEG
jgi:hypothetical protein